MLCSRDDELGSASDLDCILRLAVLLILLLHRVCLMLTVSCTIDSHSSIAQPGTVQDEARPVADASPGADALPDQASEPSQPRGLAPPPGLAPFPDEPIEGRGQPAPSLAELATPAAVPKKSQSREHKPTPSAVKSESSVEKPDVVPQATAATTPETKSSKEKALRPESVPAEKEPKVSRRESRRAASKAKDKAPVQSTPKLPPVEKAPAEEKSEPKGPEKEENAWARKAKAGTLRISTKVPEADEQEAHEPTASTKAAQPSSTPPSPSLGAMTVDSPAKRVAPRTLRITDAPKIETPKTETPPIPPYPQALPTLVASSKVSSRRHSLTSNNQPGTPSSDQVDISSVPSATPSRATSPAPVVGKKRADKKAKKQKKREEEETQVATVAQPTEEHSPVLSRLKKTRKPTMPPIPSRTVSAAASTGSDVKADEKADKLEPTKQEPKEPEPAKAELSKSAKPELTEPESIPDLVEDVEEEDAPPSPPIKPLESTKSQRAFFASLGPHLDHLVNNSSFTKPVSSTSHLDGLDWPRSFPSALDWSNHLQHISKPFVLTPEEETERAAGRPVRRQADNGRISGRIIETIRGTRLRKLSPQEEDELVRLEDSINAIKGPGFWGGARAVDFVSSNYNGLCPLDAPAAAPPRAVLPENSFILEDVLAYGHQVDPLDLLNCFVMTRDDVDLADVDLAPPPAHGGATPRGGKGGASEAALPPARSADATVSATDIAAAMSYVNVPKPQAASPGGPLDAETAAAAAAAAAAIGSTAAYLQEAISQDKVLGLGEVIGRAVENATGALSEDLEKAWMAEKKRTEELEARLHELIKKNRQLIMEGCL
jgi:hypothetical protein